MTAPVPADVLSRLKSVLSPDGWSQDAERIAPKLVEWRGRWTGTTPLLVLPKTVDEVSAVIGICAETGTPVVPQGGDTGLVSGQIPQGEVLLSTDRMRAIRDVNVADDVLVAEAGVPLAAVHEAAEDKRRRVPLSLASEGTATIGGLVSTNAGGTQVLRYGTMRDLVLGLEAVLPNGEVWNGLKRLRKDNTGYDLKQLLIGAEGTLGVVTAATLKLFPKPAVKETAWATVASPQKAVELLQLAKKASGGAVTSFEIVPKLGLELVLKHIPDTRSLADGVAVARADRAVLRQVPVNGGAAPEDLPRAGSGRADGNGHRLPEGRAQEPGDAGRLLHPPQRARPGAARPGRHRHGGDTRSRSRDRLRPQSVGRGRHAPREYASSGDEW